MKNYNDINIGDIFFDADGDKVIIDGMPSPHMFTIGVWSDYAGGYLYEGDKVHITELIEVAK